MTDDTPDHRTDAKVIEDIWRHTVSQIPSDYGKLVYLASLRNSDTGEYHHYGLAEIYSEEQCDQALRQSHRMIFYRWLALSLSAQCEDLLVYFDHDHEAAITGVQHWEKVEPYMLYFPEDSQPGDRELFVSDLRMCATLLLSGAPVFELQPDV